MCHLKGFFEGHTLLPWSVIVNFVFHLKQHFAQTLSWLDTFYCAIAACQTIGLQSILDHLCAAGWVASIRPTWRSGWSQASAPLSPSSSPSTTRWRWNRPWCWWRVGAPPSCQPCRLCPYSTCHAKDHTLTYIPPLLGILLCVKKSYDDKNCTKIEGFVFQCLLISVMHIQRKVSVHVAST